MNCTRCASTGFLNIEQLPGEIDPRDTEIVIAWIAAHDDHDVQVCDCCGDGEDWYGEPGQHYSSNDLMGKNGPYASNGGLCQCH